MYTCSFIIEVDKVTFNGFWILKSQYQTASWLYWWTVARISKRWLISIKGLKNLTLLSHCYGGGRGKSVRCPCEIHLPRGGGGTHIYLVGRRVRPDGPFWGKSSFPNMALNFGKSALIWPKILASALILTYSLTKIEL